jgi:hypothetical protein
MKALAVTNVLQLLDIANVCRSSLILSALMKAAICCSETLVVTGAVRRHFPEDGILHRHRRKNLKSYTRARLIASDIARTVP